MRVAIETHGCRLNQAEGDSIASQLRQAGCEIVPAEQADVFILNSCTITHDADADARKRIRKAHQANPEQKLLLTGCYANSGAQEAAALPGVVAVVGNADKIDLPEVIAAIRRAPSGTGSGDGSQSGRDGPLSALLAKVAGGGKGGAPLRKSPLIAVQSLTRKLGASHKLVARERKNLPLPASASTHRTRAYLKIQDGCNYSCTFCIVPSVRGRNISHPRAELRKRFLAYKAQGVPEVILTGVHLGTYGWDFQERDALERLIAELLEIPDAPWLRLGSLDPHELRPGMVDALARFGGKGLCRHVHLPVQSGSDAILAAMRRAHRAEDLRQKVAQLRLRCPGIAVGTDVIVGFPGEDQAAFDESYALMESLKIDYAHIFRYSKREGTKAATMPRQVDGDTKKKRHAQLSELMQRRWRLFREAQEGRSCSAVILGGRASKAGLRALSEHYIPLRVAADPSCIGQRVTLKIQGFVGDEQVATMITGPQ